MNYDDAKKLIPTIAAVDGGCSVCVESAAKRLMRDFPEIDWKSLLKSEADRTGRYWKEYVDKWQPAEAETVADSE